MTIIEDIEPPSTAREAWAVLRAGFVVVAGALCVIAAGRPPASAAPPLQAFQARYDTLDRSAQATFRALAEALPELEARRVELGAWPAPAALADLAPFDDDSYAWTQRADGPVVVYVGTSRREGRPFLLHVTEPTTPSAEPTTVDETHHRLADGRLIHVGIWSRPDNSASLDALDRPMLSGWIQYLATTPRPESRR